MNGGRHVGLLATGLLLVSCGSKGAAGLTASATDLTLAIDHASPLAAELQGGFDVHLDLGQYAPAGTDVTLTGGFQLVRPADQSNVALLSAYPSAAFPYHLDPGGSAVVHFVIGDKVGTPGQVVASDVQMALCQAGSVALSAELTDSAAGTQGTPLSSAPTNVAGCSP